MACAKLFAHGVPKVFVVVAVCSLLARRLPAHRRAGVAFKCSLSKCLLLLFFCCWLVLFYPVLLFHN